jgi:hypothetical protein
MKTKCKILDLTGGGTQVLSEVMALIDLYDENTPGHQVLKDFDYVVGNSGGSIIISALVANMRLGAIRDMFTDPKQLKSIFNRASLTTTWMHKLFGFGPQYRTDAKLDALRLALGPMGDTNMFDLEKETGLKTRIVIPAYDTKIRQAVYYRSQKDSPAGGIESSKPGVTWAEAAHASSTAPINYYDRAAKVGGRSLWDGAMAGWNDPILCAMVEALANDAEMSDIIILSLSRSSVVLPFGGPNDDPAVIQVDEKENFITDISKAGGAITENVPKEAIFMAHTFLGGPMQKKKGETVTTGPVVRMGPDIKPVYHDGRWAPPNGISSETFKKWSKLGMDLREKEDIDLLLDFTKAWMAGKIGNQPIRSGSESDRFHPEIGDITYADAKRHWLAISQSESPAMV